MRNSMRRRFLSREDPARKEFTVAGGLSAEPLYFGRVGYRPELTKDQEDRNRSAELEDEGVAGRTRRNHNGSAHAAKLNFDQRPGTFTIGPVR